jgi:hypothetical protein
VGLEKYVALFQEGKDRMLILIILLMISRVQRSRHRHRSWQMNFISIMMRKARGVAVAQSKLAGQVFNIQV